MVEWLFSAAPDGGALVARPPRSSDAIAATPHSAAEVANTTTRPSWKGVEIRCGKKARPVSARRPA